MGKKLAAWAPAFLVLTAGLSACGSSTALSPSQSSKVPARPATASASGVAVPWIDKPATIPTTTVVTLPLSAACKPADLKVGTVSFGLATAQEGWRVPITNMGPQPCSLPDHISEITAIGPSGSRVALSNGTLQEPEPPVVLEPNITKMYGILSGAFCDSQGIVQPSQLYSSVEMTLPTGILDLSKLILRLCSNKITSGFQPSIAPPPAPGTVASLNAKLEIPKSVKAGSTLDYQVVLDNKLNVAVDLSPCPVYKELITVITRSIKTSSQVLELNCSTVHSIGAHQKITYEMEIPVPSEVGPAKFGWQIAPSGPYAGSALTIVR